MAMNFIAGKRNAYEYTYTIKEWKKIMYNQFFAKEK